MANLFTTPMLLLLAITGAMLTKAASLTAKEGAFGPKDKSWRPILDVDGCLHKIFVSFFDEKFDIPGKCCEAVEGLTERCFNRIFSKYPFNHAFPPFLKDFCDKKTS